MLKCNDMHFTRGLKEKKTKNKQTRNSELTGILIGINFSHLEIPQRVPHLFTREPNILQREISATEDC